MDWCSGGERTHVGYRHGADQNRGEGCVRKGNSGNPLPRGDTGMVLLVSVSKGAGGDTDYGTQSKPGALPPQHPVLDVTFSQWGKVRPTAHALHWYHRPPPWLGCPIPEAPRPTHALPDSSCGQLMRTAHADSSCGQLMHRYRKLRLHRSLPSFKSLSPRTPPLPPWPPGRCLHQLTFSDAPHES